MGSVQSDWVQKVWVGYELEGVEFPWLMVAAVVACLIHPAQKVMRECEWVLSDV